MKLKDTQSIVIYPSEAMDKSALGQVKDWPSDAFGQLLSYDGFWGLKKSCSSREVWFLSDDCVKMKRTLFLLLIENKVIIKV